MNQEEKVLADKRKRNMKLYSIHRMLTADLLFYYAVKFIFLTQIKGLSASDIVLASAFWGIFKVVSQIPTIILIDKIGSKKSLVISDALMAVSVVVVMLSINFSLLILANLLSGIATAIREVAENVMLNKSIPGMEEKSSVFAKIDAKGLSNFYFLSAISAIISGFLFDINGYIPMTICVIILIIAVRVATLFEELEEKKKSEKISSKIVQSYRVYFKDIKLAFSFIFNSRRLKALMIFAGLMYGIIMVMNTYEMGLLQEIGMSATGVGTVYAAMQIIAGIASKMQYKLHNKFKNKTLSVIGISYTVACLISAAVTIAKVPYGLTVFIIVVMYTIRYIGAGSYYVLIKKYITNFTNAQMVNKVYSAYSIVTGIGNGVIAAIGSIIASNYNLKYSTLIFGVMFTVVMYIVLLFMKTRVGLKPEQYRTKDINYKEYVSLK